MATVTTLPIDTTGVVRSMQGWGGVDSHHDPYFFYSNDFTGSAGITQVESPSSLGIGYIIAYETSLPSGVLGDSDLGNYVTVYYPNAGVVVTYMHLQQGSITLQGEYEPVTVSDNFGTEHQFDVHGIVDPGSVIAVLGVHPNGNHLHVQYGTSVVYFPSSDAYVADATSTASTSPVSYDTATGKIEPGLVSDDTDITISIAPGDDLPHNATLLGFAPLNATGDDKSNIISGNSHVNILVGNGGNDSIYGGGLFDELEGGSGNDLLDGGEFQDNVTYLSSPAGVVVDLTTGKASDGWGGTDALVGIEVIIGSNFDDQLTGDGNANNLFGNAGKDKLSGGAGDDRFYGGQGNDQFDGGEGFDTAVYANGPGPVSVDISKGKAIDDWGNTDKLTSIESVFATDYGDTLLGGVNGDFFWGFNGDDTVSGRGGNDTLFGNSGKDTLAGGAGNDFLGGGVFSEEGDDTLDGGTGNDTLFGDEGNDTLDGGADSDELHGGLGDDSMNGGGAADVLYGGDGSDKMNGGGGNDAVSGEQGNDTINVSSGNDVVLYTSVLDGHDTVQNFDGNSNLFSGQDTVNLDSLFDSLSVSTAVRASRVSIVDNGATVDIRIDADGNSANGYELNALTLNTTNAVTVGQDILLGTGGGPIFGEF